MLAPAAATASAPPRRISAQHLRPERLERVGDEVERRDRRRRPSRRCRDSALVAAMRPNAYGSSTIGVKKSTVCTSARSSLSRTTPASSAVSVATSTRGSVGSGSAGDDRPQVGGGQLAAAAGAVGEGGQGGRHLPPMMPGRARVHRRAGRRRGGGAQRPGARWRRPSGWWRPPRPQLQRILNEALESADWFGSAHQAEVLARRRRRRPRRADRRRAHADRRGDAREHAHRRGGRVRAGETADDEGD